MTDIGVQVTNARAIDVRFKEVGGSLHSELANEVRALTERLYSKVLETEPFKTGRLRSETVERNFTDNPDRVAGYVSIFSPDDPGQYAKAAVLEYGSDKPRRIGARTEALSTRFARHRANIAIRMSKPVHIEARRYLRGPLADMRGEVMHQLQAAIERGLSE